MLGRFITKQSVSDVFLDDRFETSFSGSHRLVVISGLDSHTLNQLKIKKSYHFAMFW